MKGGAIYFKQNFNPDCVKDLLSDAKMDGNIFIPKSFQKFRDTDAIAACKFIVA